MTTVREKLTGEFWCSLACWFGFFSSFLKSTSAWAFKIVLVLIQKKEREVVSDLRVLLCVCLPSLLLKLASVLYVFKEQEASKTVQHIGKGFGCHIFLCPPI